jgi:uncharacterized protein
MAHPHPTSAWRRRVGLACLAVCAILLAVWGLNAFARSMLFPRHLVQVPRGEPKVPGLDRRWIESAQGPVELWILPGRDVDADRPGPAVVFAHGNGELIDFWPEMLEPYRRLGVTVVLPEYRGYGRSSGDPSEAAIRDDLRATLELLQADPRIDARRIVYHGRSLGGGALGTLLATDPPAALVLESTFTSVPDVASWAPRFLIPDHFDTLGALGRYSGPTLVLHGTRDEIVPVDHARRLAAVRSDIELVLYEAGHNDMPPPGSDYWSRIERFLERADVLAPR